MAKSQGVRDASRMERINHHLVVTFAAVLRASREAAGLTQEDLADRADVSVRFISFLETGRRQPSLSALATVCKGLNVSMSSVLATVEARMSDVDDLPIHPAVDRPDS